MNSGTVEFPNYDKNASDSELEIKQNMIRACVALQIDAFYTSNLPPWFGVSNPTKVTHLVDEQNPTKLESIETTMGCNHECSASNTISQPYQIFEKPPGPILVIWRKKSRENASPVQ